MKFGIILLAMMLLFALWKTTTPEPTNGSTLDVEKAVIIDVRSPKEFDGGHVKDAVNLPIDSITEADVIKVASKDQPIILYCHSGGRASVVHSRLTQWGFSDVHNLKTKAAVQAALNQP